METIAFTAQGHVLIAASGGAVRIHRSTDGGRTWELARDDSAPCLLPTSPALGRYVYACGGATDRHVWRSYTGAAGTWERVAPFTEDWREQMNDPNALAELFPSDSLPTGRLVAGVDNGVFYSDDGGQSWTQSEMHEPFRWMVLGLAVMRSEGHPYGGTVYAQLRDFLVGLPAVYASEDGGHTWELRAEGPQMQPERRFSQFALLALQGSGELLAGTHANSGPCCENSHGRVLRSADGGRTWEDVSEGLPGKAVNVLVAGRDGRVYAGTDVGVYRTMEAVVPVSSEEAPEVETGLRLEVYPNPAQDRLDVMLALGRAGALRLVLYDALGRAVAAHEGRVVSPGRVEATLRTDTLPSGAYVLRATLVGAEGSHTATATVTVVR